MGIALLIVSGCAIALRLSAEPCAPGRSGDLMIESKGGQTIAGWGAACRTIGTIVASSRRTPRRAFTPFSQQPVVRAMLLRPRQFWRLRRCSNIFFCPASRSELKRLLIGLWHQGCEGNGDRPFEGQKMKQTPAVDNIGDVCLRQK